MAKEVHFIIVQLDELYYYADKNEAKYYKLCPKCNKYICPFCYRTDDLKYNDIDCCLKGKIYHKFFYEMYYYLSPKELERRGREVEEKPWKYNYIPFIGLVIFEENMASLLYWLLKNHKKERRYGNVFGGIELLIFEFF